MRDYKKLVEDLKFCAYADDCIGCARFESVPRCKGLDAEAADAIEELLNKLCDWCGACLEERNPYDCEIIGTAFAVPPDPGEGSLN